MNEKSLLPALFLAIGIALAGFFISYSIYSSRMDDRNITVKGLAEKIVKANQATWVIQFNSANDDLAGIYQGIANSQTILKGFLENEGFETKNIALEPISIVDNQSTAYGNNDAKSKRYSATAGISLTTDQVDKVIAAIQKTGDLIQKGVVITQSTVNYEYTELNAIKPVMLDQATESARQAAESFAKNAHSKLGNIKNANQGLFTIGGLSENLSPGSSVMKKVRVVTTVQYYLQ